MANTIKKTTTKESKTSKLQAKKPAKVAISEDKIDTKIKIEGKSLKIQDIAPTGISELEDTKTEVKKLADEITPDKFPEELPEEKPIKDPSTASENLTKNTGVKEEDDYAPEILSAVSAKKINSEKKPVIWTIVLVLIIVVLLALIGFWYKQQYLQNSTPEVKSSSASNNSTISIGPNSSQSLTNDQQAPQTSTLNETSEIENKMNDVAKSFQDIENDSFSQEPTINFDIAP